MKRDHPHTPRTTAKWSPSRGTMQNQTNKIYCTLTGFSWRVWDDASWSWRWNWKSFPPRKRQTASAQSTFKTQRRCVCVCVCVCARARVCLCVCAGENSWTSVVLIQHSAPARHFDALRGFAVFLCDVGGAAAEPKGCWQWVSKDWRESRIKHCINHEAESLQSIEDFLCVDDFIRTGFF